MTGETSRTHPAASACYWPMTFTTVPWNVQMLDAKHDEAIPAFLQVL